MKLVHLDRWQPSVSCNLRPSSIESKVLLPQFLKIFHFIASTFFLIEAPGLMVVPKLWTFVSFESLHRPVRYVPSVLCWLSKTSRPWLFLRNDNCNVYWCIVLVRRQSITIVTWSQLLQLDKTEIPNSALCIFVCLINVVFLCRSVFLSALSSLSLVSKKGSSHRNDQPTPKSTTSVKPSII